MNALFNKLYWMIMEPVYRRLSRDVSLRLQELTRVQVEFQEKWSVKVSDELVALSLRAAPQVNAFEDNFAERSTYDVIDIVGRIHKTGDLVELSEKLSIPLDELASLYMKYGDVNRAGIARIMDLERQVKQLSSPIASVAEVKASPTVSNSHSRATERISLGTDRDGHGNK